MILYRVNRYLIYIPWRLFWTAMCFGGVALVAPFSPRYASRWFGRAWGRGLIGRKLDLRISQETKQ